MGVAWETRKFMGCSLTYVLCVLLVFLMVGASWARSSKPSILNALGRSHTLLALKFAKNGILPVDRSTDIRNKLLYEKYLFDGGTSMLIVWKPISDKIVMVTEDCLNCSRAEATRTVSVSGLIGLTLEEAATKAGCIQKPKSTEKFFCDLSSRAADGSRIVAAFATKRGVVISVGFVLSAKTLKELKKD